MHGVADQLALGVEQAEVHSPRVDADAGQLKDTASRTQPGQHLRVQPQDVGMQVPEHADRRIGEPVQLMNGEGVRADLSHHDPAAGSAQVDRRDRNRVSAGRQRAHPRLPG